MQGPPALEAEPGSSCYPSCATLQIEVGDADRLQNFSCSIPKETRLPVLYISLSSQDKFGKLCVAKRCSGTHTQSANNTHVAKHTDCTVRSDVAHINTNSFYVIVSSTGSPIFSFVSI